ncbi:hypothetical protein Trydic_g6862 [Trypoxylus dichotomus]
MDIILTLTCGIFDTDVRAFPADNRTNHTVNATAKQCNVRRDTADVCVYREFVRLKGEASGNGITISTTTIPSSSSRPERQKRVTILQRGD